MSEHLAAAISGDSTLLVQGTAGHAGGVAALRLELRPAADRGPERAGARAEPGAAGDAGRRPRPGRGADPHPVRRAGRPHHHPVREDAAHPRAGRGGAGRARASTSSPRPTTATAASTSCRARCAVGSTRCCCRCRPRPTTRSPSSGQRVADIGQALELPDLPSADAEIRRVVTVFRELRAGVTEDGRISLKMPTATLSPAEAISVVTNGLVARRPLRRRGAASVRSGRQRRRRRRQGPRARHGGVAGVRRGGPAGPAGLGGLLPRLPRDAVTVTSASTAVAEIRVLGIRHHGPGSARSTIERARRIRPGRRVHRGPAGGRGHRCRWPPIRPWRRRSPSSPTTSTIRRRRRSGRSPASAPSGRPCAGRSSTGARCGSSTCPRPRCWPRPDERSDTLEQPDPLAGLAAAAGYDDVERWWDDLVEHSDRDVFAAVGEAMAAAREAAPPRRPVRWTIGGRRRCAERCARRDRRRGGPGRRRVRRLARPGVADLSLVPAEADAALLAGCRRSRSR